MPEVVKSSVTNRQGRAPCHTAPRPTRRACTAREAEGARGGDGGRTEGGSFLNMLLWDEAALSVEGSPTPLPKFASYLARVRLGAV